MTILTVPPHSIGKLQPLDVGVSGLLETAFDKAVDSSMMRNPGQTYDIYEIADALEKPT